MSKVRMVCRWCGSDKIHADAYANWNVEKQEWELETADFDKGHYCDNCDGECRVEEQIIDG